LTFLFGTFTILRIGKIFRDGFGRSRRAIEAYSITDGVGLQLKGTRNGNSSRDDADVPQFRERPMGGFMLKQDDGTAQSR
jgi:hypothetical protein